MARGRAGVTRVVIRGAADRDAGAEHGGPLILDPLQELAPTTSGRFRGLIDHSVPQPALAQHFQVTQGMLGCHGLIVVFCQPAQFSHHQLGEALAATSPIGKQLVEQPLALPGITPMPGNGIGHTRVQHAQALRPSPRWQLAQPPPCRASERFVVVPRRSSHGLPLIGLIPGVRQSEVGQSQHLLRIDRKHAHLNPVGQQTQESAHKESPLDVRLPNRALHKPRRPVRRPTAPNAERAWASLASGRLKPSAATHSLRTHLNLLCGQEIARRCDESTGFSWKPKARFAVPDTHSIDLSGVAHEILSIGPFAVHQSHRLFGSGLALTDAVRKTAANCGVTFPYLTTPLSVNLNPPAAHGTV